MPNDKLSEAQAIYVSEIRKVQESADTWRDFLDFSAKVMVNKNQSEFEFSSKLIIHARNSRLQIADNSASGKQMTEITLIAMKKEYLCFHEIKAESNL